jgi:DNA-binding beta-propeller fold protein YncE
MRTRLPKILPVLLLLLIASALFLFSQLRGNLAPVRKVQDPYPVFTDVAVDPDSNIVAVTDENLFSLRTYDRDISSNEVADPRTVITGPKSEIDFACGVAIDPTRREIYTANNDTAADLMVFSYDANGEVPPSRQLTPAATGTWGVALDLVNDEVAVTVQHINKVAVYRRTATGTDKPLRFIQGSKTGLSDPHGIYIDAQHNEIFVANHDSYHEVEPGADDPNSAAADYARGLTNPNATSERRELRPSKGKFVEPSITVYSRTASGDVLPIRVIQGPGTELSLPMKIFVDVAHDEIFVANSGSSSILVFRRGAGGNAAPIRKIEGALTGLKKPVGLFVDTKNDEVWAANPGDHTITVYKRTAQGNVAPLRRLRGAPEGTPAPGIGNPGGIAYDPLREQLLVPN